jgi:hypothetical protein
LVRSFAGALGFVVRVWFGCEMGMCGSD